VVLQDHVGVPGEEDHQVDLLRAVGQSDHVLVGQHLQQQHQHRDHVQEVPDQLEHVHQISQTLYTCNTNNNQPKSHNITKEGRRKPTERKKSWEDGRNELSL
jgi:hypothetical protein